MKWKLNTTDKNVTIIFMAGEKCCLGDDLAPSLVQVSFKMEQPVLFQTWLSKLTER